MQSFFICGEGGVSELSGHPFGHILVCSEPSSGFPDKLCYVLRSKAILNTMQCSEYTQTKFILRWFFLANNVCLFVCVFSVSILDHELELCPDIEPRAYTCPHGAAWMVHIPGIASCLWRTTHVGRPPLESGSGYEVDTMAST